MESIIYGIGGDPRRPGEELLIFEFDGRDVSFWMYYGITSAFLTISIEMETWISVDGEKPYRAVFTSSIVRADTFIPPVVMSLPQAIEDSVKIGLIKMVTRNWDDVIKALPEKYAPKNAPRFLWEIRSNPFGMESLVSHKASTAEYIEGEILV